MATSSRRGAGHLWPLSTVPGVLLGAYGEVTFVVRYSMIRQVERIRCKERCRWRVLVGGSGLYKVLGWGGCCYVGCLGDKPISVIIKSAKLATFV